MQVWMDNRKISKVELSPTYARDRIPQGILFVDEYGLVKGDNVQTDESRT